MGMDYYGPMVQFFRFLAATLATVLATGSLNAWAQPSPGTGASQDNAFKASAALLDATLFYEILVGEILARSGDPGTGYSLLLEAARRSNDERLYQRAADIALQSRSGESALIAAQAWKDAWPKSREANRYVLQILIALNRIEETANPLKQELETVPTPGKAASLLAVPQLYRRASDKTLAAAVVEKALANDLTDPSTAAAAWTAVGRMRLLADNKYGALDAARRAQKQDPMSDGPAILALELMEGGTTDAEPVLRTYLEGKPTPELRMAYARLLLELQRYTEARRQMQIVTHDKPELTQAWLVQAALQFQEGSLDEAEASLLRFTALAEPAANGEAHRTNMTPAYLLHAQIAEKRGDYAGAEKWLSRIENERDLFSAQTRRASLLARQGKLPQALALIRSMPATTDEARRMVMMAEVQLLRDARVYGEAYALQEQVVAQAPEDDDLVYELAMLAEKTGRHEVMERLLRQIIQRKPNYHHAYNALGYSLAERGIRLAEARELVLKALSHAPDDPFITDSLGWVEFRLGNLQQALSLLETAFKTRPDPEIAAHLGEVLWTMGKKDRAMAIWKESARLNADNETLRETLKRFGVSR
mgnify:FL=1